MSTYLEILRDLQDMQDSLLKEFGIIFTRKIASSKWHLHLLSPSTKEVFSLTQVWSRIIEISSKESIFSC